MRAALEHLAGNQPEPEDAKPLLRAILTRAFLMLEVAKQEDCLLKGPFGCNILIKRMPNRCVTNYMKTRSTYTGLPKSIQ
ncbi:MAG: hypothetical protein EBU90_18835 [Proteobacteria bacterium]|nr:hypothetical protein [Pseudomonadota bacterium]NBP15844.1 hypothetical protein [bacterium]